MRISSPLIAVALMLAASPASADCPRLEEGNAAATALANAGDKARAVDIDAAIAKYLAATAIAPDDQRLWWKLALAYEKKGAWADEASACAMAEAADAKAAGKRTHADYYAHHGAALARLAAKGGGAWQDAVAPLRTAVALDPRRADAYADLGRALLGSGDEGGAMKAFDSAVRAAPRTMRHYVVLADLYQRGMFFDAAERVLYEGVTFASDTDPDLVGVHIDLGAIDFERGEMTKAVDELVTANELCDPSGCSAYRTLSFELGAAFAACTPPRKTEAIQQLVRFFKITCKGAQAARFTDECARTVEIAQKLGTTLQ